LFSFTAQNTPVEKLEIKDLMVDSNARENIPPEGSSAYVWEHCADFHIYGSKTNGGVIKNLRMDNITGVDPIADHIYIAGVSDSGVSKATFTNMFFSGRSRERGDITITGRLDSCSISNFNGQLIEVELNEISVGERFNLNISNSSASKRIKVTADNTIA